MNTMLDKDVLKKLLLEEIEWINTTEGFLALTNLIIEEVGQDKAQAILNKLIDGVLGGCND